VGLFKRIGIHLAGIGIGGALGLISSTLMLFVLVDASVNGSEEPVWLMLCVIVGVFVGAVIYKLVLWSSKGSSYLQ
jgi:peptidoglycan biosynthesis protein MviN/MurJ (putative lipid II flippase)